MVAITKPVTREIVEDFAREISERRIDTARPQTHVINFRNDLIDGIERKVYQVPIELLRFRKDNGRIASDVLDYERNEGILDETDEEAQAVIRRFLKDKDPEKTDVLMKSIMHSGQRDPAIITCDGFLINGNRRKMVMDSLHSEHPENESYAFMKVVILPGKGETGGPPTLLEIEKIENRYQLQSDGKSEYYGFDRALSMKRKIEIGLSLKEQLQDDPRYANATKAIIEKAVKEAKNEYLAPLDCIDRYLKQFHREGQYRTISTGRGDPEGRWQAFKDYSNTYARYFNNPKRLIELGIEEDEIGEIEEAAFNIIRLRHLSGLPKVHTIMRNLYKYCRTKEGKKQIINISEKVEPLLPSEQCFNEEGHPLSSDEIDAKWAAENRQVIIHNTKKAMKSHENLKEKETPIGLLEAAYKKLTHDDMDMSTIDVNDLKRAMDLAREIQDKASDLESQIYHHKKNLDKLVKKKT